MAGRCPARGPAGGGGGIPATRQIRARVVLAALSAAAYAAVVAYACTVEPSLAVFVGGIGIAGAALLGWSLWRRDSELLPWAVLCGGAAYVAALVAHRGGVDGAAPLVAAALLLCAELAVWSLDERHRVAVERAVVLGRASAVAALVLGGLVAAALVVALAAAPGGAGLAWTVVGAAAAVLAVGVAARLARQRPGG